jgi:hypothetical protein
LVLVLAAVTVGGVFAAPDLSKYQYFSIDKNDGTWGVFFSAYEVQIIETFEGYGLKYLSEKQLKALSAKDQETVLMLHFVSEGGVHTTINLLDYSSDRIITNCKGKAVAGLPGVNTAKVSLLNALKASKKLFGKK